VQSGFRARKSDFPCGKHRSAEAQADLSLIRARAGLVRARTGLVNTARGLAKSYGQRLRGCNVRNMNPEKAQSLSPELQRALEPLLACIESVSEQIREYNERIEVLAQGDIGNKSDWIDSANSAQRPHSTRAPAAQRLIIPNKRAGRGL
jgi:hypothetical protein